MTDILPIPSDERLEKIHLLFHTGVRMTPRQLGGIVEREARQRLVPLLPVDFDERYERRVPTHIRPDTSPVMVDIEALQDAISPEERAAARARATNATAGTIEFVGNRIEFGRSDELDWEHPRIDSFPLMWRLKLQSLEFLEWAILGYDSAETAPEELVDRLTNWVLDWSRSHSVDEERYLRKNWIPHSVSLRIINLCRYYGWVGTRGTNETKSLIARVVHKNAQFLANHVEYDVGGNHLVENAAALVVAGVFLDDERFLRRGLRTFDDTTAQFLSDGGHYERSPMYHVQTVTRYLTAVSVLRASGRAVPASVRRTAEEGIEFLERIRTPDGRIPLFNDAVFDQVLSLDSCVRYGENVGLTVRRSDFPDSDDMSASGYYWLGSGDSRMLLDGGPVGPVHLPGHSHNDFGSYVWWVDGNRFVTDTGAYQYVDDSRRTYARSVRAHNTVQVDDVEPIPIGGQYLMGRRTRPVTERFSNQTVEAVRVRYRGGRRFERYAHDRTVYHATDWWLVWDVVRADRPVTATSRIHLHPDFKAVNQAGGSVRIAGEKGSAWVIPLQGDVSIHTTEYYPRFGTAVKRDCLEIVDTGSVVEFGYLLSRDERVSVAISGDEGPSCMALDGETYVFLPGRHSLDVS